MTCLQDRPSRQSNASAPPPRRRHTPAAPAPPHRDSRSRPGRAAHAQGQRAYGVDARLRGRATRADRTGPGLEVVAQLRVAGQRLLQVHPLEVRLLAVLHAAVRLSGALCVCARGVGGCVSTWWWVGVHVGGCMRGWARGWAPARAGARVVRASRGGRGGQEQRRATPTSAAAKGAGVQSCACVRASRNSGKVMLSFSVGGSNG